MNDAYIIILIMQYMVGWIYSDIRWYWVADGSHDNRDIFFEAGTFGYRAIFRPQKYIYIERARSELSIKKIFKQIRPQT